MKAPCLILDIRYYPFMIANFQKAIQMYLRGIKCLEFHPSQVIRTPHQKFMVPIVMLVNSVIDVRHIYVTPSRQLIFLRDGYVCQYCGREVSEKEATVDHVIPKSKGGPWSWTNLVTCCPECNQKKGDAIWTPLNKPTRPEPFIVTFKKTIKKVDLETLDVWLSYLPAKWKKLALTIYNQNKGVHNGC